MTTRIINYAGWAIVLSASVYFIVNSAFHYLAYNSKTYGEFWPYAPVLALHIAGGLVALTLGPFQFMPSIRKNYAKTHRTTGKIYLISVAIAASVSLVLSIYKIIVTEKALAYGTGLALLAIAWLLTSGMAYWSVRYRNFVQHREWMVRSYVVTCAFVSFRLIFKILTEKFHTNPGATADLMAWACWAPPLMVAEAFLQGSKIRKGSAALANKKKQAVSVEADMQG
ncbi:MAG TPA: DUF2306 domain-containing protein [Mucilaginibacter sp.]|nr:DUF2306 domain-containing protein [Mucilaginibacter sp.]